MKRIQQIFQIVIAIFLCIDTAHCDLLDRSLVDGSGAINAPLGTIGKSLTDQISIGRGDLNTPGSSIYLIKRDPARAIRRGRQLFQRKFSRAEGHGPRVNFTASGDVTQVRALGAGLTDSCAACHGRPKGSAGFGGDVATRPDSRDAPHLFGLGLVEMLADEITEKLRHIRQAAIEEAASKRKTIRKRLKAKTIRYGYLTAYPDGSVDTSEVKGVDNDLRIRPFFHHGGTVSIREFIIGAFNDEMGLQAPDSVLCAVTDPDKPVAMISPAGFVYDPDLDSFQRPPVCNPSDDADGDGVGNEIDPALIDYMEFYLLNYFKPGHYKKTRASRKGLRLMKKIGCTSCHKRNLTIENDRRVADVITKYTPEKAIFNGLFSEVIALYEVLNDGEPYPQLVPKGERFVVRNIFTDLKRHDLGPAFHEREYDGRVVTEFVTEPLWGVGSSAPYGHDGRSINLDAVIRRHGGEAEASKLNYENLPGHKQRSIIEFLSTLVLFPPDDTASNLNPGNPYSNNPQDPANHGSISLGALMQIQEEGEE